MKKETFIAVCQRQEGKVAIAAEGYRVERDGFTFYIYGSNGAWAATEEKSGMLIGIYGKSRKECMEKLQAFDLSKLEKFDLDKLNKEMLSLPLCDL